MAIASSSSISTSKKKNKAIEQSAMGKEDQGNANRNVPGKRNNCPGLRVLGGRIYDSERGKTCHQCRQKTRDFVASCKKQKKDKQCTIKFCHKCLLNRYGEKAEEVELLDDWNCPKCRGICNCSCCMKKRGHKPTGILVHTAKAIGFSSVSEMLHSKGHENLGDYRVVKDKVISPMKPVSLKVEAVSSSRKRGKENSFDGNANREFPSGKKSKKLDDDETGKPDKNLSNGALLRKSTRGKNEISEQGSMKKDEHNANVVISPKKFESIDTFDGNTGPMAHNKKRSKKIKQESAKEMPDRNNDSSSHLKSPGETEISEQDSEVAVEHDRKDTNKILERKNFKVHSSKVVPLDPAKTKQKDHGKDGNKIKGGEGTEGLQIDNIGFRCKQIEEAYKMDKCNLRQMHKDLDDDIPMPECTDLTTVIGKELSPGDVGHAFQFLEFCSAFGKFLKLKKGQAESVLRELVCSRDQMYGRGARRAQYSSAVQFHIQLLAMIMEDFRDESVSSNPTNEKNSWFESLGKCISESNCLLDDIPSDYFTKGVDGYNALDCSKKLRLLSFLCDEALGTAEIREWIDDQNSKFLETEKEAKEKVTLAREKKKHLKQKLNDKIVEAMLAKNGASLSISEHEAVVASVKRESELALTELVAAMDMLPKKTQRADAVRTEPVFLDVDGRVFWRLKCFCGGSNILLQELGTADAVAPDERWGTYNVEHKKAIEEYIASRKKKRIRSI